MKYKYSEEILKAHGLCSISTTYSKSYELCIFVFVIIDIPLIIAVMKPIIFEDEGL